MLDFLTQPWPWWFSGLAISSIMFLLILGGKTFGFSSNLRVLCSICGAGKFSDFFRFNWRKETWNLAFAFGAILGGWIAGSFLGASQVHVDLSSSAQQSIASLGAQINPGLLPYNLFSDQALVHWQTWLILSLGGFLVGFGTRWAGGCTSGHAISGLSNLQLPSLIAVMGFFAGGLVSAWLILPWLLPALLHP